MEIFNRIRYWLLTLLVLLSVGTWAQQKNVLSIPDAKVSIGQAQLPVAIENTDEIIAAQFDLTLPSTISAGTEATVTNRCDGHTVIIRKMETNSSFCRMEHPSKADSHNCFGRFKRFRA